MTVTRLSELAGVGVALLLGACALLGPEGAHLSITAERVNRMDTPSAGETRWTYVLVIRNPNRRPATLFQEALTLGWDGVRTLPEMSRIAREVPARGELRLPQTTSFRQSDFQASSPGDRLMRRTEPTPCGSTGNSSASTTGAAPSS